MAISSKKTGVARTMIWLGLMEDTKMSADCFPDQVSAPLASTLMIRSTVRWTRNRVAVRALRPVGVALFSWVKAAPCHNLHQIAKDDAEEEFTGPHHFRKIEISAGPSRVARCLWSVQADLLSVRRLWPRHRRNTCHKTHEQQYALPQGSGLWRSFGAKVVLADIDLTLPRGSITALLGPSGSGKSTLLHAMSGRYAGHPRFTEWGSVEYEGKSLGEGDRPRLVQQNPQLMAATVFHALADPVRERLSRSPAEVRAWCTELVQRMGVPELAALFDQPTLELPALAAKGCGHPARSRDRASTLMVDEPTADLSDYDAYVLLELLREVARTSTLLVVLHNQKHAASLADPHGAAGRRAGARGTWHGRVSVFTHVPQRASSLCVRGSCAVPAPDADPAMLAEGVAAAAGPGSSARPCAHRTVWHIGRCPVAHERSRG